MVLSSGFIVGEKKRMKKNGKKQKKKLSRKREEAKRIVWRPCIPCDLP